MLVPLNYTISPEKLQEACEQLPNIEFRYALNEPKGDFFYDPWKLKPEFAGTIWETIYDSLPVCDKGEARIIKLDAGQCYTVHSDIDDRYHLNISGNNCYLMNIDAGSMYPITTDGRWYDMNAALRHTAANLGTRTRYQLVVRKLLRHAIYTEMTDIKITSNITNLEDARFYFDNRVSGWLNYQNKKGTMDNFVFGNDVLTLSLYYELVHDFREMLGAEFTVEIV